MNEITSIVRLFEKENPTTLEQILELGINKEEEQGIIALEFVGCGSFRKVYRINHLPLVVKLPLGERQETEGEGLEHTLNEIDAFKWLYSDPKLKTLKKYCPKIYYTNKSVILMEEIRHKQFKNSDQLMEQASKEIYRVIGKEIDFTKNFATPNSKQVLLIDWGLLGRKSKWIETTA